MGRWSWAGLDWAGLELSWAGCMSVIEELYVTIEELYVAIPAGINAGAWALEAQELLLRVPRGPKMGCPEGRQTLNSIFIGLR